MTHLSERVQTSSALYSVRERMRLHTLINHRDFFNTGRGWGGWGWGLLSVGPEASAELLVQADSNRVNEADWPMRIKDTFHEWIFYRGTVTQAAPAWGPSRFVSKVNNQITENSKSDLMHKGYTGSCFWALFGSSPFCSFRVFEGFFF